MKRHISLFALATFCGLSVVANAKHPTPPVVDDMTILKEFPEALGKLVDAKKTVASSVLASQMSRKQTTVKKLAKPSSSPLVDFYAKRVHSVVAITSVYKCNRCTKWHGNGAATGWILTEDGVMVTNYHVFDGKKVSGFGVRTYDGKVYPVKEILAASKKDDVCLFKVAGEGFTPVALGPDAKVGSDLHIIAHPDSRFYTYTSGKVSRYYRKRGSGKNRASCMAVTAEFARGSSGGPVMDSAGNVVGMVASTQSIYYPPKKKEDKKGPFQMVIRNCVPVSAIRALLKKT